VLLPGADICVRAIMNMPHSGPMRVALAPGTAPEGPAARGQPASPAGSFASALDELPLAAWTCADLPGGCQAQTGSYALPARLPTNLTALLLQAAGSR